MMPGLQSTSQIGIPAVQAPLIGFITPTGIPSTNMFGAVNITSVYHLEPLNLESTTEFGISTILLTQGIQPIGISSKAVFGNIFVKKETNNGRPFLTMLD